MSYARWSSDSAVYVYAHVHGGIVCEGCPLNIAIVEATYTDFFGNVHEKGEREWFGRAQTFTDVDSLVAHMREHRKAGHPVPDHLLEPGTYAVADFAPEAAS